MHDVNLGRLFDNVLLPGSIRHQWRCGAFLILYTMSEYRSLISNDRPV